MNATVPANLRIVSIHARKAVIDLYGVEVECEYEYDPGELPRWSPIERAHPGTPPNAFLLAVRHKGEEITELLSDGVREHAEEILIRQMEGG